MKYEAIEVYRVKGTIEKITSEEKISGPLEFVPLPDGTAILMLPIEMFIEENELHRKAGIIEIPPLSKMDKRLRGVLDLGKIEARKVLSMRPGDELEIIRKGWGRVWINKIKRLQTQ